MKTKFLLSLTLLITGLLIIAHVVHAQSLSTNVNLDWINGSSCYGTTNGQTQTYYGAIKGDSITLHVTNISSLYSITIDVSETGQSTYSTTLLPGQSANVPSYPVNSEITLEANGSVCTSGSGGPGAFFVEAASGSMSCSLQNNQVWNLSFNYSYIINTATLYRNSTYTYQFSNPKQTVINTPLQFAAQSTSATYYLYNSSDSSGRLLGQATCPAKTTSVSSGSTGTTKPPSASNSSTQPNQQQPSSSNSTPNTANSNTESSSQVNNSSASKSVNRSITAKDIEIVGGISCIVAAIVIFMQFTGLINLSNYFQIHYWQKLLKLAK